MVGSVEGPDLQFNVETLRAVPALSGLPAAHLRRLAEGAERIVMQPGRVVVAEGDAAHRFYVVARGVVEILQRGRGESPERLGRISRGGSFGELGLLHGAPRAASVVVCGNDDLEILAISQALFHELIAPAMSGMVRATDGARTLTPAPAGFTSGISIESDTSLDGKCRQLLEGEVLVRSGSRAERFFVVMTGSLEVERRGETIGRLGPGDFCGETGLLLGIPRTATIRAVEPTQVWCAREEEFHRTIAPRLLANRRASKVVLQRIANMYDDQLETAA